MVEGYDKDDCCDTVVTNPGIIKQLKEDIQCFTSEGYSITTSRSTEEASLSSSKETLILHRSSSSSSSDCTNSESDEEKKVLLFVFMNVENGKVTSSVGPFLRTCVRLMDRYTNSNLRIFVSLPSSSSSSSSTDNARTIAHDLHMMVRNSMAAALFLRNNLHIHLPPHVSPMDVRHAMSQNDDGCYSYPTMTLYPHHHLEGESNPTFQDFILQQFQNDNRISYLTIPVRTRMCTIRWTPILYQFLQQPSSSSLSSYSFNPISTNDTTIPKNYYPYDNISVMKQKETMPTTPFMKIIVCVEKLANLFRILMICRDYQTNNTNDGGIQLLQKNLILVTHETMVSRFQKESKSFLSQIQDPNITVPSNASTNQITTPTIVSVQNAPAHLLSLQQQKYKGAKNESTNNNNNNNNNSYNKKDGMMIAIDLHPEAHTINYVDDSDLATTLLCQASAIIFGFEKSGIPPTISQMADCHVQIPSRTSINLVSTISIIFHIMFNRNKNLNQDIQL